MTTRHDVMNQAVETIFEGNALVMKAAELLGSGMATFGGSASLAHDRGVVDLLMSTLDIDPQYRDQVETFLRQLKAAT